MRGKRPKSNKVEHRMARALDQLAEFEKFQEDILPILTKAINEGWSADKILAHPKAQAMLAARALTIGITDSDPARALAAIKDVMDRTHGRATERKEVKHQLEKLGDSELDAMLKTAMVESDESDDSPPKH